MVVIIVEIKYYVFSVIALFKLWVKVINNVYWVMSNIRE